MVKVCGSRLYVRNRGHRDTPGRGICINRISCQITTEIEHNLLFIHISTQTKSFPKKFKENENIRLRKQLNISAVKEEVKIFLHTSILLGYYLSCRDLGCIWIRV